MIEYQYISTPFGECFLAERLSGTDFGVSRKIILLEFVLERTSEDIEKSIAKRFPLVEIVKRDACLFRFEELFDINKIRWEHLELSGTKFQLKVWETLFKIPFGTIISYAQLADLAGYPAAVRAVGSAVGANPISLIIPCHRVVRGEVFKSPDKYISDYGNYMWGRDIKRGLIEWEKL